MSRHIVGAFILVGVGVRVFRGEPDEISFEVASCVGRGIFLDQERGRGVAAEDGKETRIQPLQLDPGFDQASDVVKSLPLRTHLKLDRELLHRGGY